MSLENVEIVRRMWDAFLDADFERAFRYIDPDVEWDGTNLPDGQVGRGFEAILDHAARWAEQWQDWTVETERFVDAGADEVIVVIRECGRSDAGVEMDERHAELYALKNRKVVWRKGFSDPREALEAVGLSE